ncbi:decarboxylase [Pedobacter sp. V48]|uniref:decarboxylase n=1 Tax=Pedobacter sp. V48 TaxID=509635 RepID=UPI0003E4E0B5|nr:decarboxylase [Pedobacter sp. V48]ETZ20997.1 hypothetical protein N824_02470 [Pedobacter sp. V48]
MEEYLQFINQKNNVGRSSFKVIDNQLWFHGINLMEIMETYGTPLKFTYLPAISGKIKSMLRLFRTAIGISSYRGTYTYCYATKSAHFSYILEEVLKNEIGLEISSAFDVAVILALSASGKLSNGTLIVCNGFKTDSYKNGIVELINKGYKNVIPILDNREELRYYIDHLPHGISIGIRVASEDRPESAYYTSRLGIRRNDILDFYKSHIKGTKIKVTILHFFIDSGISDSSSYWIEFEKNVELYCQLARFNPHLQTLDIGGGMPFRDSFEFSFDYKSFVNQVIKRIKRICAKYRIKEPDLITEFGRYTVAESSAILYRVLGRKQQNNKEKWLMLDGSFITNLPDTWANNQKYLLIPINNLDVAHEPVFLGGMTCDGDDYYDSGSEIARLPRTRKTQYLGFFHTGAYQDVLSGYGGIHHCLLPSPKQIVVDRNLDGTLDFKVFAEEQNSKQALKILGF